MDVNSLITNLKGVGQKTNQLFNKLGVYTINDLISYYPRTYDIYEPPKYIDDLEEGTICAVQVWLTGNADLKRVRNLQIINVTGQDKTGKMNFTWFNMPFLMNSLKAGTTFIFRGKVQNKKGILLIEQPEIYNEVSYGEKLHSLQPIYSLTSGLTNNGISKFIKESLKGLDLEKDYLPTNLREENGLAEYNFSIQNIHFPKDKESFILARKRLVFDEFFLFILALNKLKEVKEDTYNEFGIKKRKEIMDLIENLPYKLTGAQKKVWSEVEKDLTGKKTMGRLIQGDVGSGKTIIAVLALILVAGNGYQGALMVPTEVLARQHFESMKELFNAYQLPFTLVLLTGSMTAKEKREAYHEIETGKAQIIIGTHALIQENVNYHKLALVITDEQHRFGVKQRETFSEKGAEPHIMVMSATPIPRTLAIIIYGDLDISVIDELPAERLPIKNCVIDQRQRTKAYEFLQDEIEKGRQVYVICPMVEENESLELENVIEYTDKLRSQLKTNASIEYLHGKMKAKDKNEIMDKFVKNEIQVLVSTTVIEVGVNVPNASLIIVENAERFGLAQLHQLRGRVGRGKHQSYCILISSSKSKETKKRLQILNQSNDGFFIASEDLKLRGPGDLFGIRQSGLLEFKIGDLFTDAGILQAASEASKEIMKDDYELVKEEHFLLKEKLASYLKSGIANLNI